jgi:hypothetical protein
MDKKILAFALLLVLVATIFVHADTITTTLTSAPTQVVVEAGKSVSYYLSIMNANILTAQSTQTTPIAQITPTTTGTSIVKKEQTLTASCIENILNKYDSPVKNTGLGEKIILEATKYNIDAGYALATFRAESSFGKNGEAVANKSIGNRRDTSGNFIKYSSWEEGISDWFSYIDRKYVKNGITIVETIAPIYAPSSENNTTKYITDITGFMQQHQNLC